jgi:hypothetical protein
VLQQGTGLPLLRCLNHVDQLQHRYLRFILQLALQRTVSYRLLFSFRPRTYITMLTASTLSSAACYSAAIAHCCMVDLNITLCCRPDQGCLPSRKQGTPQSPAALLSAVITVRTRSPNSLCMIVTRIVGSFIHPVFEQVRITSVCSHWHAMHPSVSTTDTAGQQSCCCRAANNPGSNCHFHLTTMTSSSLYTVSCCRGRLLSRQQGQSGSSAAPLLSACSQQQPSHLAAAAAAGVMQSCPCWLLLVLSAA